MEETRKENRKIGTVLNYVPDYELKPVKLLTDFRIYEFLPFGADNLFPQATALFGRTSPNHRGVINSKVNYTITDITVNNKKFDYLNTKVNFQGENLKKVLNDGHLDYCMGGNAYIEIITDPRRSFIWFNHIDYTKVRLGKDQKSFYLHSDWWRFKGIKDPEYKVLPRYPEFISEKNEYGAVVLRSIIQLKDYEPEFYFYGIPSWIAGQDAVLIDLKTNKWNLSRLKNAFMVSGFLVVPVKDPGEGAEVVKYIEDNHTGEGNQAKLMVLTKSRATDGEKADQTQFIESKQENDGSWDKLHNQSLADIVVAHSWFRSLTAIADNTGFDTKRILNEYEIALRTVISKDQQRWIDLIKRVFADLNNQDPEISFINKPPVEDYRYQYVWQIKKKRGDDDWNKDDPNQQIMIMA
jgi:hypothetical protein